MRVMSKVQALAFARSGRMTTIAKNELLTRVILPAKTANWRGVYLKLRLRGSIDYPLAGVAIAVRANGKSEAARMAVTA